MGAAMERFPPNRLMSEKEREQAVHEALRDGTVTKVRALLGWSTADLADRLNVLPSLVEGWERLEHMPSPYASAKLWTVLVCGVRYEAAPPHPGAPLRLP